MNNERLIPLHTINNEKFAALVLSDNKIALSKINLMDGTINEIHSATLRYNEYALSPTRLFFYFSAFDCKHQTIHFYRYKSTDFSNPQKMSISLKQFVLDLEYRQSIYSKLIYLDEQYVLIFIALKPIQDDLSFYDCILLINIENGEVSSINPNSPNSDSLLPADFFQNTTEVIKKRESDLKPFEIKETNLYKSFVNDAKPIYYPYVMDLYHRKQGREFLLYDGELSYSLHLTTIN